MNFNRRRGLHDEHPSFFTHVSSEPSDVTLDATPAAEGAGPAMEALFQPLRMLAFSVVFRVALAMFKLTAPNSETE